MRPDGDGGECYIVPGLPKAIGLGLAASAGTPPSQRRETGTRFRDIRKGAWDPTARLADQDIDGVTAEVLYPTIGLYLLGHVNRDYARRCFASYNEWLADFARHDPARLIGYGVSVLTSVTDAVADLDRIHELGLRGLLLPVDLASDRSAGQPRALDPLWEAAAGHGLPVTFHAAPSTRRLRWPTPASRQLATTWDAQETLTQLVMSGVFERHPDLRVVFAEFGTTWVPDFVTRLDRLAHDPRAAGRDLPRPPSDYLRQNVAFTTYDLFSARPHRFPAQLLWANDFPHASSTWPHSTSAIDI